MLVYPHEAQMPVTPLGSYAGRAIAAQLGSKINVDYGIAYDNLLNAANAKLNRPLKDGFCMEGSLSSAGLESVSLPADGVVIALRASGDLKILSGM